MRRAKKLFNEHKYIGVCVVAILLVLFSCLFVSYARYALEIFSNRFLMTQNFYFSSNKLKENTADYAIENWAGTGSYDVNITMQNTANLLVKTTKDIKYNVECESVSTKSVNASDVKCSIDGESAVSRTISKDSTNDSFVVKLTYTGTKELQKNDSIKVKVTAISSDPYIKELSGTFEVFVGYYGVTYTIEDKANQVYLNALITNARNFYVSLESFTDNGVTYGVNEKINLDEYAALSDENKKKCSSARITLSWDANQLRLDTTGYAYMHRTQGHDNEEFLQEIDGKHFIKKVMFDLDAESSMAVKFFKLNIAADNSYPEKTNTLIVDYVDDINIK